MREYGISEDHIFSSRDLTFVKGVMRATNQKGVDVVLNSLSGEVYHTHLSLFLIVANTAAGIASILGFACTIWTLRRDWEKGCSSKRESRAESISPKRHHDKC